MQQALAAWVEQLPKSGHKRGGRSAPASPIISLVISMRSFCFSNSRMILATAGRFMRRFMAPMACPGEQGERHAGRVGGFQTELPAGKCWQ